MILPFSPWQLALMRAGRVAHLATVAEAGRPHVLPVVYACDDERIYTPLDGKPKRVALERLRRVRDIRANSSVALVVDRYSEDWGQLAWVQVRGRAEILSEGALYDMGVALLQAKYPQYAPMPLLGRPLIVITPEEVRGWRAAQEPEDGLDDAAADRQPE